MGTNDVYDRQAFRDFEQGGWNRSARSYDAFARVTAPFMVPVLDAAGVSAGSRVLDLACGPGDLSAQAASRGAAAIGVDLAGEMVAEAQRRNPGVEFREGPAEALPFPDRTFDAVCCSFGMHHFSEPEQAAAEVYRVLSPNGRFAFTVWSRQAGPNALFELVSGAVREHGDPDVPLPAGRPLYELTDRGECLRLLRDAGFVDVHVDELSADIEIERAERVLDIINATVRTRAVVEAQAEEAKPALSTAIVEGARQYQHGTAIVLPMAAVLASASRPAA